MPGLPELSEPQRRALRRVGHKGADLITPGNTRESFDAALAAGVDMIEFDILPEQRDPPSGRLLLAHSYRDIAQRTPLTLEEGLAHLRSETFGAVELNVDLKLPGYELRVVDALGEAGLLERALISTHYMESLDRIRATNAPARLGWSVPRVSRDYTRSPVLALPAYGVLRAMRRLLPRRAATAIRAGRCDAIMAHWRLIGPRLVEAVAAAGGELYAWTVDDLARIRALEELGVTGVISNDPRLFGSPA